MTGLQWPPRFPVRKKPEPEQTLIAILWTMTGPSGRVITCDAWSIETGIEVRVSRAGELVRSQLCRGPSAQTEAVRHADEWHATLVLNGFTEVE